jgi:hypothetical protein
MEFKFKQVTADEWADYLSSFRTYATEGIEGEDSHSVMYDKLSQGPMVGVIIGVVHYHRDGTKTYEIAEDPVQEVA